MAKKLLVKECVKCVEMRELEGRIESLVKQLNGIKSMPISGDWYESQAAVLLDEWEVLHERRDLLFDYDCVCECQLMLPV